MKKKLPLIWPIALAVSIVYFLCTYGDLPERLATHFDASGNPNGYMTKSGYLIFILQFTLLMNVLLVLFFIFMSRIPLSLLSIPKKDYWLSRPEITEELFQRLKLFLALLGAYENFVFLFAEHMVYQANVPNAFFQMPISGGIFFIALGIIFLVIFAFVNLQPPRDGLNS